MDKIDLTVVIPNYNKAGFLRQCVESVVNQTYGGAVEILIVDDCSTDDSARVIAELAREYPAVRPLLLEENGKVSHARNVGLVNARGQYVTFLDSDDYYFAPDKLEREMRTLAEHPAKGDRVVAFSRTVRVDYTGETVIPTRQVLSTAWLYPALLLDVTSRVVMRDYIVSTDVVRQVGGYNEKRNLYEDNELLMKLARFCRFRYSGGDGTAYRDSQAGLSKRPQSELEAVKQQVVFEAIRRHPRIARPFLFGGYYVIYAAKRLMKAVVR